MNDAGCFAAWERWQSCQLLLDELRQIPFGEEGEGILDAMHLATSNGLASFKALDSCVDSACGVNKIEELILGVKVECGKLVDGMEALDLYDSKSGNSHSFGHITLSDTDSERRKSVLKGGAKALSMFGGAIGQAICAIGVLITVIGTIFVLCCNG